MPHSECGSPRAPPRRRKMTSVQQQQSLRGCEYADFDGGHKFTALPRPPPRRHRKSHDGRSTVLYSNYSCLTDGQFASSSSSSSSVMSWYDMNQTITPTSRSLIDLEQPDNDMVWSTRTNTADQFRSPSPSHMTKNCQFYQNSFCFHTTFADHLSPVSNDEASDLPKSADKNREVDKEQTCDSEDNKDIFSSWKRKYGHLDHNIASSYKPHDQRSSSSEKTVSEQVHFSEIHPMSTSPLSQPTKCVSNASSEPKSVDKNCESRRAQKQFSSDEKDDDDDDDYGDMLASFKTKKEDFYDNVASTDRYTGTGNYWRNNGDQRSRKCELEMSDNMAVEHDDDFQTKSSISASSIDYKRDTDTDDVSMSNGNGKRKGHSAINGRCWWQVNNRSSNERTWKMDDLETRCADLLAWQREQRLQRQQQKAAHSSVDLVESSTWQPLQHTDRPNLSEKLLVCGRQKPNRKSNYGCCSTLPSSAENNREISAHNNRNWLEINCGGDQSPTSDNQNQHTAWPSFIEPARSNGCTDISGCDAELCSSEKSSQKDEESEAASEDSCLNYSEEFTSTDRLSACRMTLLEDMAWLSGNETSTDCSSLSVAHNDDRPPSVSTSSGVIKANMTSSSTLCPVTALRNVTTAEMNADNIFPGLISPSPFDTDSGTSGSRSYSSEHENYATESLICSESVSSVTLPILTTATSRGVDGHSNSYSSIWSSSYYTRRIGDRLKGLAYRYLGTDSSDESSVPSGACSLDFNSHLLTEEKSICNENHTQHPEGKTDKVYVTTDTECEKGTVISSEAKSLSKASSIFSSAPGCDFDIQSQSSTTEEESVCGGDQASTHEVNDCSQNIFNETIPRSSDVTSEMDTKSISVCDSAQRPHGPMSWLFSSYGGCGNRMKGLRIPSSTTTSAVTSTTSHDGRPRLDLPLIAGVTAKRIGDGLTPSVLPATLLPRPFMPRSCYRSIRPFISTIPATRKMDNNVDGGDYIDGTGNGLPSQINNVKQPTTATDDVKGIIANQSTSSFRDKLNNSDIKAYYTSALAVREPADKANDRYSSLTVSKGSIPSPTIDGESASVGNTEDERRPSTAPFDQQLSNEVTRLKSFQDIPVLLNVSGESSWDANCRQSVLACHSHALIHSRHKPLNTELTETTNSRSFKNAYVSPNLGTPDQSLPISNNQHSAWKPLRPLTMPKPSLPRPAPLAVCVAEPKPLTSSLDHSVIQDDSLAISSADLVERGRTTPDGGSDSETDQCESTESTASLSNQIRRTSPANRDATTAKTTFDRDRHVTPDNKSTASIVHKNDVMAYPAINENDINQNVNTEEPVVEKIGANGSKFNTLDNCWSSSVNHSTATTSASPVEKQYELRDTGETKANSDGKSELQRQNSVECLEEASKDVDGSSHQLKTEMILLEKGVFGLGFCIEGGRDCPTGRAPVTVKRIFRGDVAARYVLSPGDEIVRVNGKRFAQLSLYEAWNYLKALPDGVVSLCVRRRRKPSLQPPVMFL